MVSPLEIEYKTPEQLAAMRPAGLLVATALARVRQAVAPAVSTAELDAVARDVILGSGGIPSFLGYQGYPATLCTSVNEQVVHAIPARHQVLREGDVISIDCGAIVDGWHGDAAITVGVGAVDTRYRRMIEVAEEAMWAGIAAGARACASGRGRLSDISHAIESTVRRAGRYGIVRGYGGHGIGTAMHQDPHVLNAGRPGRGPALVPGMALAIEPILTEGSPVTVELADGWTVVTRDRGVAVHVEHTVGFFDDGVWVLTAPDGGRSRLGDLASAYASDQAPVSGLDRRAGT